ncbi:MAG: penicillin-binding transpeptidase domain-containing protein [Anaerocolumna sp.]
MKKEKELTKKKRTKEKEELKSDQINTLNQIISGGSDKTTVQNIAEPKPKVSKKEQTNREIMLVTYIFVGLFVLVLGYFANFMISQSSEVINNAYNQRQDLLSEQIVRGDIISADGKTLAHTVTDKDGTENRVYPFGSMFAHVVGRFSKGKTGLEASENFHLLTSNNNAVSKILRELSGDKNIGDNVMTTLDSRLQKAAYNALGNYKGAVVVMEPSSGKILAMVSKPDYDPNNIDALWEDLIEDSDNDSTLVNRATQGLYPPGSTFKILTALEYIKENPDYEDYTYNCVGKGKFNDITINCYNNKVHGEEDLMKSFAKSCNSSFANIGTTLNISAFRKLCENFLFNTSLPTKLVYNQSSFVLTSKSPKKEIPQTVIGQGKTQITPLHNALIVSTVANGGVMMKPYVVDHIENQNGNVIKKYMPEIYNTIITPDEAQILTTFMREVVKDGTATALNNEKYAVAGKTGSAEYEEDKPAHAWFVGFAPAENPEIAVSIIVEGVGTGGEYAVPIASEIFRTYFNNK